MEANGEGSDLFQVMGLPRKAALDEATLQAAYNEQSRGAHPDHGGSEETSSLVNRAYETLRAPEKRLKHLLDIAGPAEIKSWRTVPLDGAMMDVFSHLGKALEASARLNEKRSKAQSELAKALLTSEVFKQRDQLEETGLAIEALKLAILEKLPLLDDALATHDMEAWRQVAMVQARLAYLSRWQTQVRESLLTLM